MPWQSDGGYSRGHMCLMAPQTRNKAHGVTILERYHALSLTSLHVSILVYNYHLGLFHLLLFFRVLKSQQKGLTYTQYPLTEIPNASDLLSN